jgi:hypothetical protein
MMLYNLKREYEERRQALIEQLQKNPSLDPATQHQIYGAIKEIENFLKTIEYQIVTEQERNMNVDLSRDQPSPFMERTKGAVYHVAHGTKKIFTHHIPGAAKKVVGAPKQYFDKRREEARLRRAVEEELRVRRHQEQLQHEHLTLEHPHQELAVQEAPQQSLPSWDDTVQKVEPMPQTKVISDHKKRPRQVARPAKKKTHPAKKLQKRGQHKPHRKKQR